MRGWVGGGASLPSPGAFERSVYVNPAQGRATSHHPDCLLLTHHPHRSGSGRATPPTCCGGRSLQRRRPPASWAAAWR